MMIGDIIIQQIGEMKTKLRREDAEKFKNACLNKAKAEKMVKQHNGFLSRFIIGKDFDELMEELKKPNLSPRRRTRIIKAAERRIEKYERIAERRLERLSGEDRAMFKASIENKKAEMEETLKNMKNSDKVQIMPEIEKDVIDEKPVIPEKEVTIEETEIKEPEVEESEIKEPEIEEPEVEEPEIEEPEIEEPEVEESEIKEPEIEKSVVEEPETKDINDLTQFTSYDEYLTEYLKQNISPDEYEKFFIDFLHKKTPANMLSVEEFTDKKRQQIENIRYKELEEKLQETEKKVIETINRLKVAQEYIDNLEKKVVDDEQKMEVIRSHSTELEQLLSEEKAKNASLVEEISQLNKQLKDKDEAIKRQQKEIFELEKKYDKSEAELKKKDERIEKMVVKAVDYENTIFSLKEENKDLNDRNNKLETNIRTTLEKINSSKEEIEKIKNSDSAKIDKDLKESKEKYHKQEAKKEESKEKPAPKHMKEKPAPKHMREKSEPKHMREKPAPKHMKEENSKDKKTELKIEKQPKAENDIKLEEQIAELNNRKSLLEELLKAETEQQTINNKTR